MRVGSLVQVLTRITERTGSRFTGRTGIVLVDHSPERPPDVGRVVDVLWDRVGIVDMYSDDLEMLDEAR